MRLITATLLSIVCLLAAGCGAGDYQKAINKNIEDIRKNSIFDNLGEPVTVPATSVTFRLPKEFINVQDKEKDPAGAKLKIPAPITMPEEPSRFYSYPRQGEGEQPVFQLFFGRRELAKGRGNPMNDMLYEMREKFPGQEPNWEDVQFPNPAGGTVAWKRCRCDAPLEFVVAKVEDGALGAAKRVPGRVELYVYDHTDAHIIMIWRVPTAYLSAGEGKPPEIDVNFDTLLKQVGGTLAVKQ